jgi:hypothetical protein
MMAILLDSQKNHVDVEVACKFRRPRCEDNDEWILRVFTSVTSLKKQTGRTALREVDCHHGVRDGGFSLCRRKRC